MCDNGCCGGTTGQERVNLQWEACALRHGPKLPWKPVWVAQLYPKNDMDCVAISCELWCMRTSPIWVQRLELSLCQSGDAFTHLQSAPILLDHAKSESSPSSTLTGCLGRPIVQVSKPVITLGYADKTRIVHCQPRTTVRSHFKECVAKERLSKSLSLSLSLSLSSCCFWTSTDQSCLEISYSENNS